MTLEELFNKLKAERPKAQIKVMEIFFDSLGHYYTATIDEDYYSTYGEKNNTVDGLAALIPPAETNQQKADKIKAEICRLQQQVCELEGVRQ